MPRLTCFAHYEVALVALLALAALVSLLRVRAVTPLAEALSVLQPLALRNIRDYGQLLLAKVALDAFLASELPMLLHQGRLRLCRS